MTRLAGIHGSSGDAVAKTVAAAAVEAAHCTKQNQPLNGERMV